MDKNYSRNNSIVCHRENFEKYNQIKTDSGFGVENSLFLIGVLCRERDHKGVQWHFSSDNRCKRGYAQHLSYIVWFGKWDCYVRCSNWGLKGVF